MTFSRSIVLLLITCVSNLAFSQVKKPPAKPVEASKQKPVAAPKQKPEPVIQGDNSLLFEITGPGIETPSWLFGTMHILCEQDAKLSAGLKKVIKESKKIYFEVDMDNMEQMMGALKFIRMNDGKKLSELLTPVEFDRVKAYFEKNKPVMPFAMMNRFKPYFITAMISEDILDCDKKSGMEQQILTEAKKSEKAIEGLETLEYQAAIFDSIPYENQAKDLLNYVDSIDNYRTVMQDAVAMYKKQNIAGLDSLMQKSDPGMADYMDMILFQRNRNWTDLIVEQVLQGSSLFAFGAGHLGGEKGVISLLRKQGLTVRAIRN